MTEDAKHEELMGALTTIANNTARIGDQLQRLLDQRAAKATVPAGRPAGAKSSPATLPLYGKGKGQPITSADEATLRYYIGGCKRSLADPEKSRFHPKERAMLAALESALVKLSPAESDYGPPPNEEEPPPF